MNEHPDLDALDALALGTLDPAEAARVEAHLHACASCRREYADVRAVLDVVPHALVQEAPPAALRERIMRALDPHAQNAPPDAAAPPGPQPPSRQAFPLPAALAAALLLALIGDAYFAFALHARDARRIAVLPATPVPRPSTPLATTPVPQTTEAAALEHRLAVAQATAGSDARQIARLEAELEAARQHPRIVRIIVTPRPIAARTAAPAPVALTTATPAPIAVASATPPLATASPNAPADTNLVAALRTGKVYAIDGVVDGEPWHLTIVQPRDGSRAVIFSGTPDAPAGDTYRTWVIRAGHTFDAGELPPEQPATLEMPMALQTGDVVAFSREPVGTGDAPTQPFLMQLKIAQ